MLRNVVKFFKSANKYGAKNVSQKVVYLPKAFFKVKKNLEIGRSNASLRKKNTALKFECWEKLRKGKNSKTANARQYEF